MGADIVGVLGVVPGGIETRFERIKAIVFCISEDGRQKEVPDRA